MTEQKKRETELDILRFISTLAVILMHSLSDSFMTGDLQKRVTSVFLVFCVPCFFMISGRFFLDPARNVSAKKILMRYVPHIAVVFVFWSAVYTVYGVLTGAYSGLNVFGILTQFIEGPYPFWFLYTLVGLYLVTPLLRKIAEDDRLLIYFVILFGVLSVIHGYLVYLPHVGSVISSVTGRLRLTMPLGFTGYYVLGYLIWHKRDAITPKIELAIYVSGIVLFLATLVAENLCIIYEHPDVNFVKQYLKPNVVIFSAALYMFFVKRVSSWRISERTRRFFALTTELGFGIYAMHALILEFVGWVLRELVKGRWLPAVFPFTQLTQAVLVYLICFGLVWLIRKIPVIGKRIT